MTPALSTSWEPLRCQTLASSLPSLEREEAEDLIKRHGGRITGSISKKTSYLLADEDVGGKKSQKAKELGTPFLTEDGLFDILRASNPQVGKAKKAAVDALPDEVAETVRAGDISVSVPCGRVGLCAMFLASKEKAGRKSISVQQLGALLTGQLHLFVPLV